MCNGTWINVIPFRRIFTMLQAQFCSFHSSSLTDFLTSLPLLWICLSSCLSPYLASYFFICHSSCTPDVIRGDIWCLTYKIPLENFVIFLYCIKHAHYCCSLRTDVKGVYKRRKNLYFLPHRIRR